VQTLNLVYENPLFSNSLLLNIRSLFINSDSFVEDIKMSETQIEILRIDSVIFRNFTSLQKLKLRNIRFENSTLLQKMTPITFGRFENLDNSTFEISNLTFKNLDFL